MRTYLFIAVSFLRFYYFCISSFKAGVKNRFNKKLDKRKGSTEIVKAQSISVESNVKTHLF